MESSLSGIRVLALETGMAGVFGSMLLGDLGAEVIKVEPTTGSQTRRLGGPGHKGEHYYHLALNKSKKSIVVDMRTPSGKQAVLDLVKVSDVVWSNFRLGVLERLGFDFESLKRINPTVVYCEICGYGHKGPGSRRPAYDVVAMGYSGVLSVTGEPGGRPLKPGPPIGDVVTGVYAALGTCAALTHRQRTGEARQVEVSMVGSMMSIMTTFFSYYFSSGKVPEPIGSRSLGNTPSGIYRTRDGWVALASNWPRIARVIDEEWMVDEPRFQTHESRNLYREELEGIIQKKLETLNTDQWVALFEVEDIAGGPVNTVDKTAADPQVLANDLIVEVDHPLGGKVKLVGNPMKTEGVPEEFLPPPTLGQHQQAVMAGLLGYTPEYVAHMQQEFRRNAEELEAHFMRKL
ncbi:MAG: CoA transferase [Chloroflexi bacterium]|nr:CoA transferase [Chloroflexota bacterium]